MLSNGEVVATGRDDWLLGHLYLKRAKWTKKKVKKKKYVSDHWDLGVAGEGALQKNMLDLHKQSKKNNEVIVWAQIIQST